MTRFEVEVGTPEGRRRVSVAWRGEASGFGVLYFFPSEPAASDRLDRRALLPAETKPAELDADRLVEIYEAARPLTDTERRFTAGDGRQWLAQSQGPVWAGKAAAEGGTGVMFTSLEGEPESVTGAGGHVGEISEEELVSIWRAASAPTEDPPSPAPRSDQGA